MSELKKRKFLIKFEVDKTFSQIDRWPNLEPINQKSNPDRIIYQGSITFFVESI